MKTKILVVAVALLLPFVSPSMAATPPAVDYAVTVVAGDEGLRGLRVDMRFVGDADGETEIALPSGITDQTDLWRGVSDFAVQGATVDEKMRPLEMTYETR